jgi:hypothetical protein
LADSNNDKYSTYLRQLCCHPQLANETKDALSNCKTLDDIEKMMVAHYAKQVDEAQEKVNKAILRTTKLAKKIRKLERKLRKRQMKKQGMKVSSSSSDSDGSDSDSDSDDIENEVINNNALNFTLEPTATINAFKDLLNSANDKLAEFAGILNGKKITHDFFVNVVERIKKHQIKILLMMLLIMITLI